ncbi:MAG: amino acid permease [Thermoplasmatales archaeon]|nr:amino acid permease [Thermoplasmatales archaeon]
MDDGAKAKKRIEKKKLSGLKKDLGLLELFCISSGAMISSGLFVLPGLAFAKAGPSVILAYLLASILMIPAMLSSAELCTAMPKAGGNFFFIDRSMGPRMGTLGGLADWFSLSFKTAFAILGIGIFVLLINPGITDLQIKFVAVASCLFFTLINIIGVKLTGKFQIAMVVTLISLLVFYIVSGFFSVQFERYTPFMPLGLSSVFATAGLVFISYAGLNKIVGVAEEVKNPGRNIPRALFLSWGIMSLLYVSVIFVTVGVSDPGQLRNSLIPISLGAGNFMGWGGCIIMGVAAILAFATTANAGLLTASRTPMAMSKDELLPRALGKVSRRGTPAFSIIFTSSFMIFVILFLDLENLVKAASTMILMLFVFVNLSLIIMRESKIRNYRPTFRSPFYPWVQIIGTVGYIFLIFEMGIIPILIVGGFILCGLGWYLIYASGKIKREYSLLHVVERVTGIKSTNYMVDEELREILIERDNITEERFGSLIKNCVILDFEEPPLPGVLTKQVAHILKEDIGVDENKIFHLLLTREKKRSVMIKQGVIVPSIIIPGHKKSDIIFVRCKKGITFSDDYPPANAVFITVSTSDEQHFYLHSLMWLTQIAETPDFETKWLNAQNTDELRDIILSSWRKQRF